MIFSTAAVQMPFIDNVTLVAISNASTVTVINQTCPQCLCGLNATFVLLNCLPNDTCEYFFTIPRTYAIQPADQARLYFPKQPFPNASQSCWSDTHFLVERLTAATPTYADVDQPRCLVLDNCGYLVTISMGNRGIVRFHPANLTTVDQPASPLFPSTPLTLNYFDGAYYVGLDNYILVVHTGDMTILNSISDPLLSGIRDMMFLNNGQRMVVVSTVSSSLFFFDRTDAVSRNYTFVWSQPVSCVYPHGLFYINDTFFYMISWGNNTVYTYSESTYGTAWTETLVLDAWSLTGSSDGNHITLDAYGRYWLSLGQYGIKIFDSAGSIGGAFQPANASIFDAIIVDHGPIYLSDTQSNRIIRIDPDISC